MRLRVLLVDNDPLFRWSIVETLTALGHQVTQASGVDAAVQAVTLAPRTFDVMLVTHRSPDVAGLSNILEIRRRDPRAALVLLTPFGSKAIATRALDVGACHVVTIPCDMREIGNLVLAAHQHQHTIECGDHVCAMLSNSDEAAELAADWLAEGLARGERCWYLGAGSDAVIRASLAARHVQVDADIRRGAFRIVNAIETYVIDGVFDAERTVRLFSDVVVQAVREGFTGFRAAADMSWAATIEHSDRHVIAYESLLKSLFASQRVTGLCLYHRDQVSPELLDGVLATHPKLHTGGRIATNPLYRSH